MIFATRFLYIFATLVLATFAFPTGDISPNADLAILRRNDGSPPGDPTTLVQYTGCGTSAIIERQPTKSLVTDKREEVVGTHTVDIDKRPIPGPVISLRQAAVCGSLEKRHETEAPVARIVKRQEPRKYQEVYLNVLVLHAVRVTLHFVWDCVAARFISRTMGAGMAINHRNNYGNGANWIGLTMSPMGFGFVEPNQPDNPSPSAHAVWYFNGQSIAASFQGTADDDDDIILEDGTWVNPAIDNGGLTATNLNTHETLPVRIESFVLTPAEYDDPHNPPTSKGSGFDTSCDDSKNIL